MNGCLNRGDEIVGVLNANREANEVIANVAGFVGDRGMGHPTREAGERVQAAEAHRNGEELKRIQDSLRQLNIAGFEADDTTGAGGLRKMKVPSRMRS